MELWKLVLAHHAVVQPVAAMGLGGRVLCRGGTGFPQAETGTRTQTCRWWRVRTEVPYGKRYCC